MSYQLFKWGPFLMDFYRFFFIASVIISVLFTYREGIRQNLNQDRILGFIFSSLLGGIMGMRLIYLFIYGSHKPVSQDILQFKDGGLMFAGGLFGGFLAVILYTTLKKISAGPYLDMTAPYLVLGGVLGRMGYISLGKAAAYPWPWTIKVDGEPFHPDQAYMIFLLSILLVILWYRKRSTSYQGELFIWFLLGYGAIEFSVGFFRIAPMYGVFSVPQLMALVLILTSIFFLSAGKILFTATHVYRFSIILNYHKKRVFFYLLPFIWVFVPVTIYLFIVSRIIEQLRV